MRIEGLVGRTMRAHPSGLSPAMAMAARAGFLRPGRGGWIVLPLGMRVLSRMSAALLDDLGCQPVGVLALEGEDVASALSGLLKGEIQSYRQLPLRIAAIPPQGWADSSPEAPLGGSDSLGMIGAFAAEDELAGFVARAYANLRKVAGIAGVPVDTAKGVDGATAVMACGAGGSDRALTCAGCKETWLGEAAPFAREESEGSTCAPMERVHTPGASTIQALGVMLGVERRQTLKALFLATEKAELVFAVLRGDLDASMAKLAQVAGAERLRAATDDEIIAGGAVPGFASPAGLQVRNVGAGEGVWVIADRSVYSRCDFVAGANAEDYHFVHVDPRRDFAVTQVADIALAPADARCAACGSALTEKRGTILVRTSPLDAPTFSDGAGAEKRASAAWTRVDLLALLDQVIGACADDKGIAWPVPLSPADVHVVSLKEDGTCLAAVHALERDGLSVLYDDRPIGAGAKFTDADLIGCPLRVTVSSRSLQAGGVELAARNGASPEVVPISDLPGRSKAKLSALMSG